MKINPATEKLLLDKDSWKAVGLKILNHLDCPTSYEGIGRAIDLWRSHKSIPEEEMIDGLGFLFGDLCISEHGGEWVLVEDQWGVTPAIRKAESEGVLYSLDIVSKRLREENRAEQELPSVAHVYNDMS